MRFLWGRISISQLRQSRTTCESTVNTILTTCAIYLISECLWRRISNRAARRGEYISRHFSPLPRHLQLWRVVDALLQQYSRAFRPLTFISDDHEGLTQITSDLFRFSVVQSHVHFETHLCGRLFRTHHEFYGEFGCHVVVDIDLLDVTWHVSDWHLWEVFPLRIYRMITCVLSYVTCVRWTCITMHCRWSSYISSHTHNYIISATLLDNNCDK